MLSADERHDFIRTFYADLGAVEFRELERTAAAYGMPLIVELGVFFDVLVGALIIGIYSHRLQDAFDSVDTSKLTTLKE